MIYKVIDRETISDLSTAIGFTAAKLTSKVTYAIVNVIGGAIRACDEGATPVADTTGVRFTQDSFFEEWGSEALADFLAIDDGGTAKLEVVYMGTGD